MQKNIDEIDDALRKGYEILNLDILDVVCHKNRRTRTSELNLESQINTRKKVVFNENWRWSFCSEIRWSI